MRSKYVFSVTRLSTIKDCLLRSLRVISATNKSTLRRMHQLIRSPRWKSSDVQITSTLRKTNF